MCFKSWNLEKIKLLMFMHDIYVYKFTYKYILDIVPICNGSNLK